MLLCFYISAIHSIITTRPSNNLQYLSISDVPPMPVKKAIDTFHNNFVMKESILEKIAGNSSKKATATYEFTIFGECGNYKVTQEYAISDKLGIEALWVYVKNVIEFELRSGGVKFRNDSRVFDSLDPSLQYIIEYEYVKMLFVVSLDIPKHLSPSTAKLGEAMRKNRFCGIL